MKKIVSLFTFTLLIAMPLLTFAKEADITEHGGHFIGIVETDGETIDLDAALDNSKAPVDLGVEKKYALVVSLNNAVEEVFSEKEVLSANLVVKHTAEINMSEEENHQFEVLLSYQTKDDINFISDEIQFEIPESISIKPSLRSDGCSAFSIDSDQSFSAKEDLVITADNTTEHFVDLTGVEEKVIFLLETSPSDSRLPLIAITESDTEKIGDSGATLVISVFILLVLVGLAIGFSNQIKKRKNHK